MSTISTYYTEGTQFLFEDPEFSVVRDCVPGQAYEPVVASLLSSALREPGAKFADIGALYGFFACWAARHVPGLSVVAFEPEPTYVDVMHRNIARNGVDVRVAQVALTDKEGDVSFHGRTVEPDGEWSNWRRDYLSSLRNLPSRVRDRLSATGFERRIVAGHNAPAAGLLAVPGRTWQVKRRKKTAVDESHSVPGIDLDTWALRADWSPTVAKIDVHGGEGLVLRGMRDTLARSVQHLFLELHTPDYLVDTGYEEIFEIIEDAGLTLFEVRGFRHSKGALVRLTPERKKRMCDPQTWTPEELYYMRFLYACRTP
ncbi:FkbM family methyltransferase [Streptomyces sp. ISL-43]|uniref:FkbM family methyltransferase n=1 Tax=Streptomyces sp. ISL-43 TaxID=2819183 RepID=UPI001BE561F2|nr:FkbM family methyltransferase [Streptomyces sp. ISL-43]MBT2447830.1 FkbM family methyltransferase [Streptomyces sp. ISL-43]